MRRWDSLLADGYVADDDPFDADVRDYRSDQPLYDLRDVEGRPE